jgi:hypothetical protein
MHTDFVWCQNSFEIVAGSVTLAGEFMNKKTFAVAILHGGLWPAEWATTNKNK